VVKEFLYPQRLICATATAFTDVTGVFVLPPPNFDPEPGFPEAKAVISAVRQALDATRPAKVV